MQEQERLIEEQTEHKHEKPRFWLSDEHREVAEAIVKKHITKRYMKKGCKRCNLTGIMFITDENLVTPCSQCVNTYPAREEWAEYCKGFSELRKRFLEE